MWDIDNLNPETRFYYGEDKKEWVDLRVAPKAEVDRMRKEAGMKYKVEYKPVGKTLQRVEGFEASDEVFAKFDELATDYAIVNWNLFKPDGTSIPCTKENKLKMVGYCKDFSNWIDECLKTLQKDNEEREDLETKN